MKKLLILIMIIVCSTIIVKAQETGDDNAVAAEPEQPEGTYVMRYKPIVPIRGKTKFTDAEKREIDEEFDRIIREYCLRDGMINMAKKTIDRDKAIQKISGTTNLTELHNATGVVVDLTPKNEEFLREYKKLMGHEFKKSECP